MLPRLPVCFDHVLDRSDTQDNGVAGFILALCARSFAFFDDIVQEPGYSVRYWHFFIPLSDEKGELDRSGSCYPKSRTWFVL